MILLETPFEIFHACKKLPKVVFEYDCMCWFGNSYNLKLLDDGRLVRLTYGYSKLGPEDCMCDDKEYVLLNSPELVKEIKKLIKENKEDLKKFQGKYQIIIFWMEPEKRLDLEDIIYK